MIAATVVHSVYLINIGEAAQEAPHLMVMTTGTEMITEVLIGKYLQQEHILLQPLMEHIVQDSIMTRLRQALKVCSIFTSTFHLQALKPSVSIIYITKHHLHHSHLMCYYLLMEEILSQLIY